MGRVFLKGDIHGHIDRIKDFCDRAQTTEDDILILLGDVGINIYGEGRDTLWRAFKKLPITILCVRGNHEARPEKCNYKLDVYDLGDKTIIAAYHKDKLPNVYFLYDGWQQIKNHMFFVINGAYSVDKEYRLKNGWFWEPDEQLSEKERERLWNIFTYTESTVGAEYVLSHTCPSSCVPTQLFLSFIDQSKVDHTMEDFCGKFYDILKSKDTFKKWYCGHFHADLLLAEKVQMLYENFEMLDLD